MSLSRVIYTVCSRELSFHNTKLVGILWHCFPLLRGTRETPTAVRGISIILCAASHWTVTSVSLLQFIIFSSSAVKPCDQLNSQQLLSNSSLTVQITIKEKHLHTPKHLYLYTFDDLSPLKWLWVMEKDFKCLLLNSFTFSYNTYTSLFLWPFNSTLALSTFALPSPLASNMGKKIKRLKNLCINKH